MMALSSCWGAFTEMKWAIFIKMTPQSGHLENICGIKSRTKVDKTDQVRKFVMMDMHTHACLFVEFWSVGPKDGAWQMFKLQHWQEGKDAIVRVTVNEESLKYGLMNSLYYLTLKASAILLAEALAVPYTTIQTQVDNPKSFQTLLTSSKYPL